jgi:hypothetical protein
MWRDPGRRTILAMLRRAALLPLLACAAALPAAAQAAPPHRAVFDVQTFAQGSLKAHYHQEDPSGEMRDETYKFDFSYEADYQDVAIVDGRFTETGVRPIQTGAVQLHDATVIEKFSSGVSHTYVCTDPDLTFYDDGQIANDDFSSDVSTPLVWRPASRMVVMVACGSGQAAWHREFDLVLPGGEGQKPIGQGPVDLRWDIPYEVLRMDHFEQLVAQEPFQKDIEMCPGYVEDETVECALEWSGKVIMDRVHGGGGGGVPVEDGNGDDVTEVPPPPAPAPAPSPPAPPVATGPVTPPATSTPTPAIGPARLSRDRRRITFTVRCPTACSGTATAKAASKPQRFALTAGARKTITLTLKKPARRGVKTTVSVAVTPKAGGATTKTTLKA